MMRLEWREPRMFEQPFTCASVCVCVRLCSGNYSRPKGRGREWENHARRSYCAHNFVQARARRLIPAHGQARPMEVAR